MFYKHSNEGKVVILIVYVDDIVLTGDDCNELEKLKGKLAEEFEIKDLGGLKYFLGMELLGLKKGIFVNQRKYVLDLLDETAYKSQECEGPGSLSETCWEIDLPIPYTPNIAFSVSMMATWLHGEVKKQNVVARNSAEAKFRVVAHAISIAHNPVLHDRTKHVEVDKHFIKKKIDNGLVCMTYIPTKEQVADVFTKGLHKRQFNFLVGKLAMEDIFKLA
ncbi:Copia protein [Vitis vinifera]|uniref:Copia protein n=1 Tax=Vitis vinifera TaxID=29760 RepID=A0A438HJY9_VITVI|nr:Copia protein [Vitis vinifera]